MNAKQLPLWYGPYFCPNCGEKTLYQHEQWSTGDASEVPFCYCATCGNGVYMMDVVDLNCSYLPSRENNEHYKEIL